MDYNLRAAKTVPKGDSWTSWFRERNHQTKLKNTYKYILTNGLTN